LTGIITSARAIYLAQGEWASEEFFPGGSRDFPKFFSSGGPKVVKFGFYLSKLKKQPLFANNFKIQGGQSTPYPPFRRPSQGGTGSGLLAATSGLTHKI